jgi:hypothetical protein
MDGKWWLLVHSGQNWLMKDWKSNKCNFFMHLLYWFNLIVHFVAWSSGKGDMSICKGQPHIWTKKTHQITLLKFTSCWSRSGPITLGSTYVAPILIPRWKNIIFLWARRKLSSDCTKSHVNCQLISFAFDISPLTLGTTYVAPILIQR